MLFLLFAPPFYGQKKNVLLKIFFPNVVFYIKPSRRVSVSMHTGQEWLKQQQQENNGLSIKLLRHSNFLFSFFSGLMSSVFVVVTSLLLSVCMVVVVDAPFFFFSLYQNPLFFLLPENLSSNPFSQSKQKKIQTLHIFL